MEELLIKSIHILSWMLIGMGVLKMGIWLLGEVKPDAFSKIKSESLRNFMTGTSSRLIFGLGGLLTVALGIGSILLINFMTKFL